MHINLVMTTLVPKLSFGTSVALRGVWLLNQLSEKVKSCATSTHPPPLCNQDKKEKSVKSVQFVVQGCVLQ
jgi:hypothetical protein